MENLGLGRLITSKNQQRDAIHIAVAPVVANMDLEPGQHIGFVKKGNIELVGVVKNPIGVVDPFLRKKVRQHDRFWILLYPGSIISLRHEWVHPDFPVPVQKIEIPELHLSNVGYKAAEAIRWLEDYAAKLGITYMTLMDAAAEYLRNGIDYCGGEEFEGAYTDDEFWDNFQTATGRYVDEDDRGNFFRCAC